MSRHSKLSLPLVVLALALLVMAACSPALVKTTPKLPPGFLEAPVPAGDLSTYVYVSQEEPISTNLKLFGPMPPPYSPSDYPPVGVDMVMGKDSFWNMTWVTTLVGPNLDSLAASAEFMRSASAETAEKLLLEQTDVRAWRDGNMVSFVRGTGGWANTMEQTLRVGDGSPIQEAYPTVWDLLHLLPETPPGDPVAAGFVRVNQEIMDSLAAKADLDMAGMGQAFGAINVTDIAFAAYSDASLALPAEIGLDYFKETGAGAIFVARSSYPGFILSFFLGTFADRLGLEEVILSGGQKVLSRDLDDAHIYVKALGNTLFLSLAPTREKAEALMASALEHQGGG